MRNPKSDLVSSLREALDASWDAQTSYQGVSQPGNPAYGQCYPTAHVVQHYFPDYEIVEGKVWTGAAEETHFWNAKRVDDSWLHLDLSWQQFPAGSVVKTFEVLSHETIVDSAATKHRCALLLQRVEEFMRTRRGSVGY